MGELTRRGFLATLAAAAAGALVLDPERLLWIPGAKTFFLPPERSVVVADPGDVAALFAALGGPFLMGGTYVRGRYHDTFGGLASPDHAMRLLSDQEYRLVVDRGRQMLAAKLVPRRRGPIVLSETDGWPTKQGRTCRS